LTANDPLIARFARACGAESPLDLQVDLGDGTTLARGKVHQPFTLVGRSDSCDVTLTDPGVQLHHCWLQVIEGRVFCVDLATRSGVAWPSGEIGSGWLEPGVRVGVGPFHLLMRSAPTSPPAPCPGFHPLTNDSAENSPSPPVELEFLNGRRGRDHWAINRVVTLIGRSDACKIHLNADDVAPYHCGLVLTRDGPWVVDLSGRGVLVNGEHMRVAPLGAGVEFRVGRFAMSTRWRRGTRSLSRPTPAPSSTPTPMPPRKAEVHTAADKGLGSRPASPPPTEVVSVPQLFAEDEVPIGGATFSQSTSGLPSSHIMADAFGTESQGSHGSSAVLVTGAASSQRDAGAEARPVLPAAMALAPGLGIMMKQMADIYDSTVEQLQQSVLMLVQVCGRLLPDQAPVVLRELTRIQEVNTEIARLQSELARETMQQVIGEVTGSSRPPRTAGEDPAPAERIQDRITSLQGERQNRWGVLAALLSGQADQVHPANEQNEHF
jgi:pSer/pThr/pTyr-binding forkhead associated (FHA) protein